MRDNTNNIVYLIKHHLVCFGHQWGEMRDNNTVYLIKHPFWQEPFKNAVQIISNIIIPQIICL